MKKKQITAIILSAMMVISACMSSSSITAFAADNAITEETGVTEEEIESIICTLLDEWQKNGGKS